MDLLLVFKSPRKFLGFPLKKNTTFADVTDPSTEGGLIEIPLVYDLYFPEFFNQKKSYCFVAQYATELMGRLGTPKRCVMCLKKSVTAGESGWVCNVAGSITEVVNPFKPHPKKKGNYQRVRTPGSTQRASRVATQRVEVICSSSSHSEPTLSDSSSGHGSDGVVPQDSGDEVCADGCVSDDSGDRVVRNVRLQLDDSIVVDLSRT